MIPKFYPPAQRRIIKPGANDPTITPVVVILHVAASLGPSLYNWFNGPSAGIESHLYLTKKGKWEQMRQFDREADAQLGGNSWVGAAPGRLGSISIETEGLGGGWWTRAQKREIKAFLLWARENLGIPLVQVEVPNPPYISAGGIGYHSLFKAWNQLGKTCPGPRRIAWFRRKLVPWMAAQNRQFVTLGKGESLSEVADRANISVAKLWRLNRAIPRTGDKLRVR